MLRWHEVRSPGPARWLRREKLPMADVLVATFMIVTGLAIAGIWTTDIVRGARVDLGNGLLRARDQDGSLLLPHWVAEYTTAAALLVGAAGLLASTGWATAASAAALAATWYSSVNSLGWALADSSRLAYAVPMAVGIAGSMVSLVVLITG